MVTIFKPDLLDYNDYGYNKPILYTEQFLREIAIKTDKVLLNEEHTNDVIGSLSNFSFIDGALQCDVSDGVDLEGKGISPKFEFELIEHDNHYEAVDGVLINCGRTDNPRSHIVCNSVRDDDMSDNSDALEQAMKVNSKLERELAMKDNELNEIKKKLNEFDSLQEEIASLKKENDKFNDGYDDLKAKAKAFDEAEAKQKSELIDKIADGDDALKERLADHSLKQLTDVFDVYTKNTSPRGVPSGENSNEGNPTIDEEQSSNYEEINDIHQKVFGKDLEFKF
ncbi:MAG: hypothetical protein HUJ56_11685 [Erysipelotrichaceae bacterium]|nr:hypothetical protein [Erysipelotrichaceae bacterium]